MEQRSGQGMMWGRYILFVVLSILVIVINSYLAQWISPPKPRDQVAVKEQAAKDGKPAEIKAAPEKAKDQAGKDQGKQPASAEKDKKDPAAGKDSKGDEAKKDDKTAAGKPKEPPAEVKIPDRFATLGSADPDDPFRMLVTLTGRGAAVARIELSSLRFRDDEDRSGYLGYVAVDPTAGPKDGALVQVVGPGTPAAKAGLLPGDVITAVGDRAIPNFITLEDVLAKTKPGQAIRLKVLRNKEPIDLSATLTRHPLQVVQPESSDPLSFLLTLRQLDDQQLKPFDATDTTDGDPLKQLARELDGVSLRNGNWELINNPEADLHRPETWHRDLAAKPTPQIEVRFGRWLPQAELAVIKTYGLEAVPEAAMSNATFKAYHVTLKVKIVNAGKEAHKVAYQLDGPTGLPKEGWWYASKISRNWGAVGLRDVVAAFSDTSPLTVSCTDIAADQSKPMERDQALQFIGVDAQYFTAALIPQYEHSGEMWFQSWQPIRVGKVDPERKNLTDTSARLTSATHELAPGGVLSQSYQIFAGPKKPELLVQYGLQEVIVYGWFWFVAEPMLAILHFFHDYVVFNYGMAIIMLTVLVRSCMFPISRKQALGAQKMQELQPEIKKIQEKYKNNLEARGRAQQDLFKKHNYNPLSGCLVVFLQLPIFIGLYRSLMVDVELRQAPLLSESIRWCSNLAAPDMLFDWSGFMPAFVTAGTGFFGLGPYFNVLPLVTIALFLWQQKKFMPPPTDEQSAMQQKMMQYMMIFMGLMFFKVASGLCLYFIASSLWSIAERQYLPKTRPAGAASPVASSNGTSSNGDAAPWRKKKSSKK